MKDKRSIKLFSLFAVIIFFCSMVTLAMPLPRYRSEVPLKTAPFLNLINKGKGSLNLYFCGGSKMSFFRHNFISRTVCFLMAFHLFYTGADMPDSEPEDLSVNKTESVLEIVLKKGLNIHNAITEHDGPDDAGSQNFEMCEDEKSHPVQTQFANFIQPSGLMPLDTPYKTGYSYLFYKEINPPPPRA